MQTHNQQTFYIVKLCRPHSLMIGWSAMDIGENVNDLDEWMAAVRTEKTYFRFMRQPPRPCNKCLNPLSQAIIEPTLRPREQPELENRTMLEVRAQNITLEGKIYDNN